MLENWTHKNRGKKNLKEICTFRIIWSVVSFQKLYFTWKKETVNFSLFNSEANDLGLKNDLIQHIKLVRDLMYISSIISRKYQPYCWQLCS